MNEEKQGCQQRIFIQDISGPIYEQQTLKEILVIDYQRSKGIPTGKY